MDTDEGSKETVVPEVKGEAGEKPASTGTKQESVPMSQYVGVKEMLRKREQELLAQQATSETKITSLQTELEGKTTQLSELVESAKNLEEQLKGKISKEEHDKVLEALAGKDAEVLEVKKELICVQYGIDKDVLKDLNEKDLTAFVKGLSAVKGKAASKPDIGGSGGGVSAPMSSRGMIKEGFSQLHPNK
jgi:hypothetical protein